MKLTSTFIAVFLAALGVLAMRYAARHDVGRIVSAGPQHLLAAGDLPVDLVDRITIARAGSAPMVFERTGSGEWNQIQPFAHPMDPFSIRQMAAAARELVVFDRLAPDALGSDQSLATLQLAPPEGEITFQWPDGSLSLALGRRSVAGRAYLQRRGEDAVCIVNQKLHDRVLDMNPSEWRETRLFRLAGADSQRLGWQQGEAKLTLERTGRQWMMTEPVRTRVDSVNLDAFLQALGRASAATFILDVADAKELANFGLASPVGVFTAVTVPPPIAGAQDPATAPATSPATVIERLLVGQRRSTTTQDRFGMIDGRPAVIGLSESVIEALFRNTESLASPTGSGVKPADVKSIVIRTRPAAVSGATAPTTTQTTELRLERDLEKWRAPDHGNAEVNADLVQTLLDQLCTLRAPQVQFKDFPRDLEIATITFHGFDQRAIDTIRVAQEKDSPSTALENGDNVLRVFPQGLKLSLTPADYGL